MKKVLIIVSVILLVLPCGCIRRSVNQYDDLSIEMNNNLSESESGAELKKQNEKKDGGKATNDLTNQITNPVDRTNKESGAFSELITSDYITSSPILTTQPLQQDDIVVTTQKKEEIPEKTTKKSEDRGATQYDKGEEYPMEHYFPALKEPGNGMDLYLSRAYFFMIQHDQYKGAFVSNYEKDRDDPSFIKIVLYTDKGLYKVCLTETGGFLSESVGTCE